MTTIILAKKVTIIGSTHPAQSMAHPSKVTHVLQHWIPQRVGLVQAAHVCDEGTCLQPSQHCSVGTFGSQWQTERNVQGRFTKSAGEGGGRWAAWYNFLPHSAAPAAGNNTAQPCAGKKKDVVVVGRRSSFVVSSLSLEELTER